LTCSEARAQNGYMRRAGRVTGGVLLALMLAASAALSQEKEKGKKQDQPARPQSYDTIPYVTPPAWKSVEIGDFYFRRKDYHGALSRYQEAVTTDPYYPRGYLGLGKTYQKLGLKRKALKAYQKYLDLLPSTKQAQEAKGVHRAIKRLQRELRESVARSRAPGAKEPPQ
jgi:tetratricopeptide (TPR) repeat protein